MNSTSDFYFKPPPFSYAKFDLASLKFTKYPVIEQQPQSTHPAPPEDGTEGEPGPPLEESAPEADNDLPEDGDGKAKINYRTTRTFLTDEKAPLQPTVGKMNSMATKQPPLILLKIL